MKRTYRLLALLATLQVSVLSLGAAETPKECVLCAGVVSDLQVAPPSPLPLLVRLRQDDLGAAGSTLDAMSPAARAKMTVIVSYGVDPAKDPMADVETHTRSIVDWARAHGPFEGIGIAVDNVEPAISGYAIKRLAVAAQGQNAASRIVFAGIGAGTSGAETTGTATTTVLTPASLAMLTETGAQSYVDVLLTDASNVKTTIAWVLEKDPSKKVWAVVPPQSPNAFYDLARTLADGATRVYTSAPATAELLTAAASFDRALIGDYAFDSTAHIDLLDAKGSKIDEPALAFVRGEDLRTIIVPRGDAASSTIVSLAGDDYKKPRRYDAAGDKDVTDVGTKGGRFLIGMPPVTKPFVFTVEHNEVPHANATKEAMDITGHRSITVEEIIRNHQTYKSYQESIQPRYVAKDATKLRFTMTGGEAVEATISGDYFSDPKGRADWVWQDFYLNGVKWKYGKIPELPLIQPEKVSQLPLDIHLTNEYRYELIRETDMLGYHTYEVRFEPPANAAANLPLYRGTVWIDTKTWARVRLSMVQLNLAGEVLSNDERVDFQPFVRTTHALLTAAEVAKSDPREILWLPQNVSAQQVISAAGRGTVVLRQTDFTDFRIDPADYETHLAEAEKSDARMVRETKGGLRYLERTPAGERVVKEGFNSSRTFLLGGIHHDAGLQYPVVPLGGIDYFNFDFKNTGIQTNVFFAGVVLVANATNPNVAKTHTNVGLDFFGIAVPTTQSLYRNGQEQLGEEVKNLPTRISVRAGHPFLQFGKVDVSLTLEHNTYQRSENTLATFAVPSDTFVITPSIDAQYARWGTTITGYVDYNRRTTWKPWGNLAEYDPKQKTFTDFGGSIARSFYLPKFQRIGVEVDYMDGTRLDRFSQYGFGFFGAKRIHGIKSGSVLADRAILGHLSYGFVFSDQFRMEAFYDHGLIDNKQAGYQREPFQGLGIAGQTVGPYGTLLRVDIGKTIGRNAQSGFVADLVFLKLF